MCLQGSKVVLVCIDDGYPCELPWFERFAVNDMHYAVDVGRVGFAAGDGLRSPLSFSVSAR